MKIKKTATILLVVLILAASVIGSVPVSASNTDYSLYIPDYSSGSWSTAIPLAYETVRTITYVEGLEEQFNTPTDLFLAENGLLYVVDSNNSRIVVLDKQGKLQAVHGDNKKYGLLDAAAVDQLIQAAEKDYKDETTKEFKGDNSEKQNINKKLYEHAIRAAQSKLIKSLNKPEGIFVDKDGDMFIADTGNNRVIHLAPDGTFVEMFWEPDSELFDYEYPFAPSKIQIDSVGRMYIVNSRDFHGFITMDGKNTFLGYVAQTKIAYDFWYEVYKYIYSKEVLDQKFARETPPYFSNFVIGPDSLIYAVSREDKTDQIKKLTPSGNNVYPQGVYGGRDYSVDPPVYASLVDIAVGKTGIVYIADVMEQEIFLYDAEGSNIAHFGGKGDYKGSFGNISAIALDPDSADSTLYVLDKDKNTIQIMRPTKFMQKVIEATALYNDGQYEEAMGPWQDVLSMHNTYALAVQGIAKAKYGERKYDQAMELYQLARDRNGYSESFYEYRLEVFRDNFGWIVGGIILAVVGLIFLIGYLRRLAAKVDMVYDYSQDRFGVKLFLHTLLLVVFHPIDGFNKLKANRDRYKWWSILVLLVLVVAVRVIYIYIAHFPMSNMIPQFTNFNQVVMMMVLPLAAWIIVGYAITSISNGKTTFKEMTISTLFGFVPYIIFTLPLGLISNLMCSNELGLYTGLQTIVLLWSLALVLLALMNLNEYSFKQMVGNTIKILFAIACVFMIVGMLYIVVNQFIVFIEEINIELVYLSNSKGG